MTFANRSVADEWWRVISESSSGPYFQRQNAQFYSYNHEELNILHFFIDDHFKSISDRFLGRVFMTLIDDKVGRNLPVIPNQDVVDHCNGDWFYIRSKSNPSLYWFLFDDRVGVSETNPTKFRVKRRNLDSKAIMIGSDAVMFQADAPTSDCIRILGGSELVHRSACFISEFMFDDLEKEVFGIKWDGGGLTYDAERKDA
ncbi:hypothetical protein BJ165DRAFT_1524937 [Panaeolus papilionaceus]|nr:hypothetical protein BJ165DRAFT_1524937 [Panaeolus papilionaceus]